MIKVLVIVNGLAHEGVSGIVLSYLENIKDKDIHMILGIAGDALPDCIERVEKANIDYVFFPSRMHDTFRYCKRLISYIKKEKIDIIHVNGNSSTIGIDLFAAMIARCKIRIAHCHSTSTDSLLRNKLLMPLLKFSCTTRFACGEKAGKWLFGNKSFYILPNAINTKAFSFNCEARKKLRNELNIGEKEILIGHVGTINSNKNQERLVYIFECLKKIYPAKLIFIGDGPDISKLKLLVEEKRLVNDVIVYGETNQVNELMSAMDAFVLPSHFEGFPTVLLEAQASGLPCIVSDNVSKETALTSLIHFLSLTESDRTWANEILKVLVHNRKNVSLNAQQVLDDQSFDISVAAQKLEILYKEFMGL